MSLAANALTTVNNLKIHLGIALSPSTTTPPVEPKLELYINSASTKIESYCDRTFKEATFTELFTGRRQNYLLPKNYPISAITELRIDNSRAWTNPNNLQDSSRYLVADDGQTVQFDGLFPTGYNNVRMIYTAGYATVPADLELCCLWLSEWYYRHAAQAMMGRNSISKGDESIGVLVKTPDMILEHLLPYKRTEFGLAETGIRNW